MKIQTSLSEKLNHLFGHPNHMTMSEKGHKPRHLELNFLVFDGTMYAQP